MKTIHYVGIALVAGVGLVLIGRKLAPAPEVKSPLGQIVDGVRGLATFVKGATTTSPAAAKASAGTTASSAVAGIPLADSPTQAYSVSAPVNDSRDFNRTAGLGPAPSDYLTREQAQQVGAQESYSYFALDPVKSAN